MNPTSILIFFQKSKTIFPRLFIIGFFLLLYSFFPASGIAQEITKGIFFLILAPILFIIIILKKNPLAFGFGLKWNLKSFFWSIGGLFFNLGVFFFLLKYTDFGENYALSSLAVADFKFFLVYELAFVNLFLLVQEVFFRGFILFYLKEKLGVFSILAQFILLAMFLLLSQSLNWQVLPYLILAISGGIISYKSNSFWYSHFFGISAILMLDAYLISQIK
jgi:membrane protease YdiL (CAAX protease family)